MNAIKYAMADKGPIVLSASSNARSVAIRVADNGPGIPREKLDAIFDPFVQLADSVAGRGGVGLGLAISRELARAMNGELSVESSTDLSPVTTDGSTSSRTEVGTTFTLTLPMALGR
jgi:signal transduction histidine kinase